MANLDRRLRNLDSLLLFFTSILGIIFSFTYILFGYREVALAFAPILILGVVIPIYIGYIRGTIILDTLEERVRGWIYFLHGVATYLFSLTLWTINKSLITLTAEFETFSGLLIISGSLLIGYFVGVGKMRRWFCRTIFVVFNRKSSELTEKIFNDTTRSAYEIGALLYLAFIASTYYGTLELFTVFMITYSILFGIVVFFLSEREIRKWVNLVQFSNFVELVCEKKKPYISLRIGKASFLISMVTFVLLFTFLKWLPLYLKIGLVLIGVSGLILFRISVESRESTFVNIKKEVPKDVETRLVQLVQRIKKRDNTRAKGTPGAFLKKCRECGREIPIASEECSFCKTKQE